MERKGLRGLCGNDYLLVFVKVASWHTYTVVLLRWQTLGLGILENHRAAVTRQCVAKPAS